MKQGFKNNIEDLTKENSNFRQVAYTGAKLQLVLMSLRPGEEIGLETHEENDQFFRFESGDGRVFIDGTSYNVSADDAVIVPARSEHNVVNMSNDKPLRFYTIYAPPHHKDGTIHRTKAEASMNDEEFDGATTE